jgi:hypothetical protein
MGVGTFAKPRLIAYNPSDTEMPIAAQCGESWLVSAAINCPSAVAWMVKNSVVLYPGFNMAASLTIA